MLSLMKINTVFLLKASSPKCSRMVVVIRNRIGGDFCEDAFGRDGHGHASKSKEIL
jgi:hypothetical protein